MGRMDHVRGEGEGEGRRWIWRQPEWKLTVLLLDHYAWVLYSEKLLARLVTKLFDKALNYLMITL